MIAAATSFAATASASPFLPFAPPSQPAPMMQAPDDSTDDTDELPARFKRQIVDYRTSEAPGTIVIDTPNTYLYLRARQRPGAALRHRRRPRGLHLVGHPDDHQEGRVAGLDAAAEMIERQPYLPRFMAGGPGNPLGARAMYLGGSVYRIHGTNDPSTIGHRVSSGCIRLTNEDVSDLYGRVNVGTKVVVLPMTQRSASVAGGIY